jgi:hypothetical protein
VPQAQPVAVSGRRGPLVVTVAGGHLLDGWTGRPPAQRTGGPAAVGVGYRTVDGQVSGTGYRTVGRRGSGVEGWSAGRVGRSG